MSWNTYVQHEFVKKVADGSLEEKHFIHFLKYVQRHVLSSSSAMSNRLVIGKIIIISSIMLAPMGSLFTRHHACIARSRRIANTLRWIIIVTSRSNPRIINQLAKLGRPSSVSHAKRARTKNYAKSGAFPSTTWSPRPNRTQPWRMLCIFLTKGSAGMS